VPTDSFADALSHLVLAKYVRVNLFAHAGGGSAVVSLEQQGAAAGRGERLPAATFSQLAGHEQKCRRCSARVSEREQCANQIDLERLRAGGSVTEATTAAA
jgi:hypothetical protein